MTHRVLLTADVNGVEPNKSKIFCAGGKIINLFGDMSINNS